MKTRPVLLIVDPRLPTAALRAAFEDAGRRVVLRADESGALSAARDEHPACVVCDVALWDVDGRDVVRRLRAERASQHVPILLVVSDEEPRAIQHGLEAGADACIRAGATAKEIVAQAQALAAMRRRFSNPRDAAPAFAGDLEQLGLEVVLQAFHLQKQSGIVRVRAAKLEIDLCLSGGRVVGCTASGRPVLDQEAVVESFCAVLAAKGGRFDLVPIRGASPASASAPSVWELTLEARRRLDERSAGPRAA